MSTSPNNRNNFEPRTQPNAANSTNPDTANTDKGGPVRSRVGNNIEKDEPLARGPADQGGMRSEPGE